MTITSQETEVDGGPLGESKHFFLCQTRKQTKCLVLYIGMIQYKKQVFVLFYLSDKLQVIQHLFVFVECLFYITDGCFQQSSSAVALQCIQCALQMRFQARVRLYTLTERPKDGSACHHYRRDAGAVEHSCDLMSHFPKVTSIIINFEDMSLR